MLMPVPERRGVVGRSRLRDGRHLALRNAIVDGTLAPGERLKTPTGELARGERTPIREALDPPGVIRAGTDHGRVRSPWSAPRSREPGVPIVVAAQARDGRPTRRSQLLGEPEDGCHARGGTARFRRRAAGEPGGRLRWPQKTLHAVAVEPVPTGDPRRAEDRTDRCSQVERAAVLIVGRAGPRSPSTTRSRAVARGHARGASLRRRGQLADPAPLLDAAHGLKPPGEGHPSCDAATPAPSPDLGPADTSRCSGEQPPGRRGVWASGRY